MRSLHHASDSTNSELTPVTNKTSEQMGVLGNSQLSGENNTFKDRTKIYNYDNPELAQGNYEWTIPDLDAPFYIYNDH
jgi:hypothetical protein